MTKRLRKPDFKLLKDAINTFVAGSGFNILVREVTKKNTIINAKDVIQDEGDTYITKVSQLEVTYQVEQESFTKMFNKSANRIHLMKLPDNAIRLFTWISFELEAGKDYIWINYERYMEECDINSINTYKSALTNLINAGIIAPTVLPNVYWINPTVMFHGSRIKKYNGRVKVMKVSE